MFVTIGLLKAIAKHSFILAVSTSDFASTPIFVTRHPKKSFACIILFHSLLITYPLDIYLSMTLMFK